LLQVARKYSSFPIVLETYRECLQDVFDLPALKQLLSRVRAREIDLVDVETQSASPYASSLLFDYIATYMYEDDTPPAERRAQAAIREAERRAIRVGIAGEEPLAAAEDAGRYRDALGVVPPSGLPAVFLEPVPDALRSLVARLARGRGPFTTAQASAWFGVDVDEELRGLERDEKLVRGELRPGGTEREWCDPEVLRRLRRASLAALRREVEPVEQASLGR